MLTRAAYITGQMDAYSTKYNSCYKCTYLNKSWNELPCLFCITENYTGSHFKLTNTKYKSYCVTCIHRSKHVSANPCATCTASVNLISTAYKPDILYIKKREE